ncbi:MAG: hypothetical protein MJE68_06965, partial [Proteobacteria bacterium]|nr:hypothetical protein [Pseudomonadota bacterium]
QLVNPHRKASKEVASTTAIISIGCHSSQRYSGGWGYTCDSVSVVHHSIRAVSKLISDLPD